MSPPSTSEPTSAASDSATLPRYEDDLRELEQLVQRIESGQLPLEELLDAYRRGAQLLASCRARLDAVEQQVRLLDEAEPKPWTAT